MAQIDLKNTSVFIEDGSTFAGAVNNVTGYAAGSTSIAIDGVTQIIVPGTLVKFGTGLNEYTVVSSTGGATPTNIVITPATIETTIADGVVVHFGPNRLEVKIGEGNLSYTEKKKYKYIRDRGRLDTVTLDDEETVEVSLEFTWEFLSSATGEPPTIEEAFKHTGGAVAWVTSSADTCEPYSVNIRAVNDPPCVGIDNEVILLRDFRYESLEHSVKDGRVSVKGNCNVTQAEVTRVAVS